MAPSDLPFPNLTERPTLITERLTLRPFTDQDVEQFQKLANDRRIAEMTSYPFPLPEGFAQQAIEKHRTQFEAREAIQFAITDTHTGQLLGGVLLFALNPLTEKAELGYWMAVDNWGRGFTSEACHEMLRFGFEDLKLNRIYARFVSTNQASEGVLRRIGMQKEGVHRQDSKKFGVFQDLVSYAILRSEWR